jgi:hypothetical protein
MVPVTNSFCPNLTKWLALISSTGKLARTGTRGHFYRMNYKGVIPEFVIAGRK